MAIPLPGTVHIANDIDQLYDDLAQRLLSIALNCVESTGVFHLALSGGSTPQPFYTRLVIDPAWRAIPWAQTHLWQVDERQVPHDDFASNWKMLRESLIDHIPTPSRQLHPMPVLDPNPASQYEQALRQNITSTYNPIPQLDFVLLGMGDDGHTASLFPASPALNEHHHLVALNAGPTVKPPTRLTLTYPLLNAAHHTAVLVTGKNKYSMLQKVASQLQSSGPSPQTLPITAIQPLSGTLAWYLDSAAADGQLT